MKATVHLKKIFSQDCGKEINALFINGFLFDYLIESDSLKQAAIYCANNPNLKKSVCGDIQKHFLDCFSEFVGRIVDLAEVNKAIRDGEIDIPEGYPKMTEGETSVCIS